MNLTIKHKIIKKIFRKNTQQKIFGIWGLANIFFCLPTSIKGKMINWASSKLCTFFLQITLENMKGQAIH